MNWHYPVYSWVAGALICSICGMALYEAVDGKPSLPHIPHNQFQSSGTQSSYVITSTASTTASGIASYITYTGTSKI